VVVTLQCDRQLRPHAPAPHDDDMHADNCITLGESAQFVVRFARRKLGRSSCL
jgi:hypothetical protein